MIIKKIFDGISDEEVHRDFLKFGRGEYKNKYLIEVKKQANNWSIKTSSEYVNFLVKSCLNKISGKILIKGIIVSTIDLRDEIRFDIVKSGNFQGIRKMTINTEVESSEILNLMKKYPKIFFALSFKGNGFSLKVKAKSPKSGKPGKENKDEPKVDFCILKTEDKDLINELLFRVGDFEEVKVSHAIDIRDIIYPKDITDLKPEEIREQSRRSGILTRKVVIEGRETITETNFVV
tara:strand:+ start:5382 stop:6086 length:705 start_codon:yes stop_codon:yes gene_type:complete